MPDTYTKLYFHVILSTKKRIKFIDKDIDRVLYSYFRGIGPNLGYNLIFSNGNKDHVHLIIRASAKIPLSETLRLIKANSSKWIHRKFPDSKDFAWQNGFWAFTVSQSMLLSVINFIKSQKEHHKKISFHEELLKLLGETNKAT